MNRQLNFLARLLILVGAFTIESKILSMQASTGHDQKQVEYVPGPLDRGAFVVHFLKPGTRPGFQVHFREAGCQREQVSECEKKDVAGQ